MKFNPYRLFRGACVAAAIASVVAVSGVALAQQSPSPAPAPAAPSAPRARSVSTVFASTSASPSSYVGVFLAEIDGDRAKALKLREERGVEITKVEEDSPAAKAGLKVADVVLDYNGQRVEGIEQFRRFVRETPPGREVKLTVSRDGKQQAVLVRVGSRKAVAAMEPMVSMVAPRMEMPEIRMPRGGMVFWSSSVLGVEAEGLEGQLAEFFGVKEGVLVRRVMKATAAEKAGLKAGDVIVKVDDTRVSTPSELTRAVRAARGSGNAKKSFPLLIVRDRKETTINVVVEEDDRSELPFRFFKNGIEADLLQQLPPPVVPGRVIRL